MSLRRRKMVLVEQGQEVLAYRDSSTSTLFTWRCAPHEPVKIHRPGKEILEYDLYPLMEHYLFSVQVDNPWGQWGAIVGVFRSFCENFTHIADRVEDDAAINSTLKEMEKQFKTSPFPEENP